MAKRTYTDDDRARVFTLLAAHDGNVERAARESNVPPQTVRDWKKKWEKEGPSKEIAEKAVDVATDFVNQAMGVRFEAIVMLRAKLGDANPRDLATIIGILDDKITRAKGLATGRVEHVHTPALPPPEELGPMLGNYLQRALGAARRRDASVVIETRETEPGHFVALPTGREEE